MLALGPSSDAASPGAGLPGLAVGPRVCHSRIGALPLLTNSRLAQVLVQVETRIQARPLSLARNSYPRLGREVSLVDSAPARH